MLQLDSSISAIFLTLLLRESALSSPICEHGRDGGGSTDETSADCGQQLLPPFHLRRESTLRFECQGGVYVTRQLVGGSASMSWIGTQPYNSRQEQTANSLRSPAAAQAQESLAGSISQIV